VQLDLRTDPEADWFAGDPADLHGVDAFVAMLAARPHWHADAACREHPEVSWFPDRGEDSRPAKAVCAACPVRDECATFAASFGGMPAESVGRVESPRKTPPPSRRLTSSVRA